MLSIKAESFFFNFKTGKILLKEKVIEIPPRGHFTPEIDPLVGLQNLISQS